MRKNIVLLFAIALLVFITACSKSNSQSDLSEQWTEDYTERQDQVAVIQPLIAETITFSGKVLYDAEIDVSNTSGEINVFVTVLSDKCDQSGFGAIVSAVGNRFIELTNEYSEYSFGNVTLFYYLLDYHGKKGDTATLTYVLYADEDTGRLTETNADLPMQILTPDEVCTYLSNASSDTRSIPDPTTLQKISYPDNSFKPAPEELFSGPSTLNTPDDYKGQTFYITGTVAEWTERRNSQILRFSTEYGELYVDTLLIPLPDLSIEDQLTLFFEYGEWDTVQKTPIVYYVYHE